jgi:hypothetical protein
MPIMLDVKLIKKVPLGNANFLVGPLSLGHHGNKFLLPFSRPKQSMSPSVVVVFNYFGCDKL